MPEKSLRDIPRSLREQYEKGKAAFERNNLDYAITILTAVLEQEPAFYDCREALRATQFRRANASGTGFFRKLISKTNPRLAKALAVWRREPLSALKDCEQVLNGDPNNLAAHRILADAALQAGLPRTALLSLEIVHRQAPEDRDVGLKLARTLAPMGHWARAQKLVDDLVAAHPNDPELLEAAKDMAAKRTLTEGRYENLAGGQGSYRDILKDKDEAVALEQERRDHKDASTADRLIQDYERKLEAEPGNPRIIRAIAELYVERREFDRALGYYQRLQGSEAVDPTLDKAIADLCARKFDLAVEQLDPHAENYEAERTRIQEEKAAFLLADARQRVERYPNDLHLRFELAVLLFEAGRIGEAIPEFQKAQNNPNRRIQAMFHLGRCFGHRNMHDLAARTLQNALNEKPSMDDEKKAILYELGVTFERMKRKEDAIEQFKNIYEVDVGYRDVAERVDAYYAGLAGG